MWHICGKTQAASFQIAHDQGLQRGFEDRDLAPIEAFDLVLIDVGTDHVVAGFSQASTCYKEYSRACGEEDIPYYPYMNGQFVFKNAVVRFAEVIQEGLAQNKLTAADIDMLIPHQANLRISQFVQKQFKLNDDIVYNNIQKYGNTTAASIPIALTEAWEEGKIKEGDTVVLAAFGSGFTWASAIIKW